MLKKCSRRSRISAAAITLSLGLGFLGPASAQASECIGGPIGATTALTEQGVDVRLQFIQKSMRDTVRLERRYMIGWGLAYVGFAAGTWFLYPFADDKHGQMISSSWNSASSVLGGINIIIDPLRIIRDQHKLEALLANPPADEPRCAVLAKAETLFIHVADNEKSARTPRAHILGFLSTVGLGLILGYGLQRAESAAINTAIGVALSELMIYSRPTIAMKQLARYRSGELSLTTPPPSMLSWSIVPNMTNTSYGVAWAGAF